MDQKISHFQLFSLCIAMQAGARYFTLPRGVAEAASNDAWISVILACFSTTVLAVGVAYMSSLYPGETISQYSYKILGKYGGHLFNMLLAAAFLFLLALQLKGFSDSMRVFMLPHTPVVVIGLILVACSLYLALQGLHPLARLTELILMPIIIVYLCISALCLQKADLNEVKPLLANGVTPVLKGVIPALVCTGPELIVGCLFPFIEPKAHIYRVIWGSGLVTMSRLFLLMLSCIAGFSAGEMHHILYPGLTIYKTVDLPQLVMTERLEIVLMPVTIPLSFLSSAAGIYFSTVIITQTFHIENKKLPAILIAGCSLLSLIIPINALQFEKLSNYWHWYIAFVMFLLLPVAIILAHLRQKRKRKSSCQNI